MVEDPVTRHSDRQRRNCPRGCYQVNADTVSRCSCYRGQCPPFPQRRSIHQKCGRRHDTRGWPSVIRGRQTRRMSPCRRASLAYLKIFSQMFIGLKNFYDVFHKSYRSNLVESDQNKIMRTGESLALELKRC